MHQHYRTKAIFLKKEDRGEADQLFTVFTEDFGKIEVLGRAIRKITSKLRSAAELFCFSEIEFIQGKNYKTLTDAILIDKFENLRSSPQRLEVAYKMAEALDSLTGREERDDKIWHLLINTVTKLSSPRPDLSHVEKTFIKSSKRSGLGESLNRSTTQLLYCYFLWNLFAVLGYAPELHYCASCHRKLLPETLFFVPEEGGVVCWQCFSKMKKGKEPKNVEVNVGNKSERSFRFAAGDRAIEISVEVIKILRLIVNEPFSVIEKLRIEKKEEADLKVISELELAYLQNSINPQSLEV